MILLLKSLKLVLIVSYQGEVDDKIMKSVKKIKTLKEHENNVVSEFFWSQPHCNETYKDETVRRL